MSEHDDTRALEGTALGGITAGDAAIIETAQQAVPPVELDRDKLYAFRLADGGLGVVNLEAAREAPDRTRGTYRPATVASFLEYVKEWANANSTVWVHPTAAKVVAVLDDHGDIDSPGWREHIVLLELIPTPEWKAWREKDGQLMDQQSFAEHIEDHLEDVVDPVGAKMLEIAKSIQTTTGVKFRSGFDLSSGEVKFEYDETVEAKAGEKGDLVVPAEFELGIAPYVGEDAYRIKARFRYRNRGGTLQLGYKLDRPEEAERTILEGIGARIGTELGSKAPVYLGAPADGSPLAPR